jgi:hypothetical protein
MPEKTTTASFHILPSSSFTNIVIRRYVVWAVTVSLNAMRLDSDATFMKPVLYFIVSVSPSRLKYARSVGGEDV